MGSAGDITPRNEAERQAAQDAVLSDLLGQADPEQAQAQADARRLEQMILERGRQQG